MIETELTLLLHHAADDVAVGPAPLPEMLHRTDRRRRRRTAGAVGGAVLGVVLVAAGLAAVGGVPRHTPRPAEPLTKKAAQAQAAGIDCTRLVTVLTHGHDSDIATFDSGCRLEPLLDGPAYDGDPVLSPDSQQVAFVRLHLHGAGTDLMLLDQTSGTTRRLDHSDQRLGEPAFSPDGRRVAYSFDRTRGDHAQVRIADLATGHITQLTHGSANHAWPSWNDSGHRLAFLQDHELATMAASGGSVTTLTGTAGLAYPFWATGTNTPLLYAIEASSGRYRVVARDPSGHLTRSAWQPGIVIGASYDDFGVHVSSQRGARTRLSTFDYDLHRTGSPMSFPGWVHPAPRVLLAPPHGTAPDGRTWGSSLQRPEPDLVSVYLDPDQVGYVAREDLDGPDPHSPEQAVRWSHNVSGSVPAYDTDGMTVLGTFGKGPATFVVTPPGGIDTQAQGALVLEGSCAYLDDDAGRHWLVLPWGFHPVIGDGGTTFADADGRDQTTVGQTVSLNALAFPDQRVVGPCAETASTLYVRAFD